MHGWESYGRACKGRMDVAETSQSSKVTIKLDFVKPFETRNIDEFAPEPQGGFTNVT